MERQLVAVNFLLNMISTQKRLHAAASQVHLHGEGRWPMSRIHLVVSLWGLVMLKQAEAE